MTPDAWVLGQRTQGLGCFGPGTNFLKVAYSSPQMSKSGTPIALTKAS